MSNVGGFQLDYLSKLSWVKDTASKHSLLHHVTQVLMSEKADMADLSKEFSSLNTVARTDYELLGANLAGMEEECKTSLGYLRLSHVLLPETRELVSRFLTWLGLPSHLHRDYPAARIAGLLVETAREVGKASEKVARDKAREAKKTKTMSLPRRTRKVKDEFSAETRDPKSWPPTVSSGRSDPALGKKDSSEDVANVGLEAYLEQEMVAHRATR